MKYQTGMTDAVTERLKRAGVSITRENYIAAKYAGRPPRPWTVAHEAELPRHLRWPILRLLAS